MIRMFQRRYRWSPIALAVASLIACGKSHDAAQNTPPPAVEKPKSPPAGSLPSGIVFDDTGHAKLPFGKCNTLANALHFEVHCEIPEAYDYPFTIEVPGSQPTAKDNPDPRSPSRDVSLLPAFGRMPSKPYDPAKSDPALELDPASELTMVFQDGTRLSGKLPVAKEDSMDYPKISEELAALSKKGFRFASDEPAVTDHSILHMSHYTVDTFGPAKHYNETDWTAVEEGVERETSKICKGYQVGDDSAPKDLPLTAKDVTVTVRNRVTGEVLQTKTFASDMVCPAMTVGRLVAGPDDAAIAIWLKSLIAKKKK